MGKLLKSIGIGIAKVCFISFIFCLVISWILGLGHSVSLLSGGQLFKGVVVLVGFIVFAGILVGLEEYYD